MAFTISLYTCTAEKIRVDKSAYLTKVGDFTGTMKGELSLMDPVILVSGSLTAFNTSNYAYIAEFDRYYFIGDPKAIRQSLVEVPLHQDVLMSYRAGIKKQYAVIARNEKDYSLYIDDSQFKAYQNFEEGCITFPSGFSTQSPSYILMLAGSAEYTPVEDQ